jgi:hypothetical protein
VLWQASQDGYSDGSVLQTQPTAHYLHADPYCICARRRRSCFASSRSHACALRALQPVWPRDVLLTTRASPHSVRLWELIVWQFAQECAAARQAESWQTSALCPQRELGRFGNAQLRDKQSHGKRVLCVHNMIGSVRGVRDAEFWTTGVRGGFCKRYSWRSASPRATAPLSILLRVMKREDGTEPREHAIATGKP